MSCRGLPLFRVHTTHPLYMIHPCANPAGLSALTLYAGCAKPVHIELSSCDSWQTISRAKGFVRRQTTRQQPEAGLVEIRVRTFMLAQNATCTCVQQAGDLCFYFVGTAHGVNCRTVVKLQMINMKGPVIVKSTRPIVTKEHSSYPFTGLSCQPQRQWEHSKLECAMHFSCIQRLTEW